MVGSDGTGSTYQPAVSYSPTGAVYSPTAIAASLGASGAQGAAGPDPKRSAKDPAATLESVITRGEAYCKKNPGTWMRVVAAGSSDGKQPGLYCSACSERGKRGTFSTAPCLSTQPANAAARHAKSGSHQESVAEIALLGQEAEAVQTGAPKPAATIGGAAEIRGARKSSMMKRMMVVLFMIRAKLPMSSFPGLMHLLLQTGALTAEENVLDGKDGSANSDRATHTSEDCGWQMSGSLGWVSRQQIREEIAEASCIAATQDETQDTSNWSQQITFCRYPWQTAKSLVKVSSLLSSRAGSHAVTPHPMRQCTSHSPMRLATVAFFSAVRAAV